MIKVLFRIFLLVITILIYLISLLVSMFLWAGGEIIMLDILNRILLILFYISGLWLIIFEIKLLKDTINKWKKL